MQIRIAPLTEDLLAAASAFNARLGAAAPFFLPESIPSRHSAPGPSSPAITWTHYLALDQAAVRGGFLLMEQPAWINGGLHRAANSQSLLSEGIRDRKYGVVSVHMLKYIEQRFQYAFMVGMGSADNPLPRLLKAAGWTLRPVPFLFHICRVGNFLREMRLFRQSASRRIAARAAALSGAGWAGIRLMQARPALSRAPGLKLDPVTAWGPWADGIWQQYRTQCSFAVVRDRTTLDQFYPLDDRVMATLVSQGAMPIGWAAWLITDMHDDHYFGNLRVATILDCIAAPRFALPVARAITKHLEEASGADLIITNQDHAQWIAAFRQAGFLAAASNYLLATSKQLTAAIASGGGEQRIHLTRGDGDGRIHL